MTLGKYGWKIRNFKAATVYGKSIGIRDKYDYTEAMLHHSLFTNYLLSIGMTTDKKDETTKDIICLDFGFGLRDYKAEKAHVDKMIKAAADDPGRLEYLHALSQSIEHNKDLYKKMSAADIRKELYRNGCDIEYTWTNKRTGKTQSQTIHYKMLYRNPSKAKQGQVMFIREELYKKARDWMTMGIWRLLPDKNAKIVELSAYAPLTASAIEGTITLPVEGCLILKDQDSLFETVVDAVEAQEYTASDGKTKTRCIVNRKTANVVNTVWDGMALIESDVLPDWCNGMALLRNHFFKACAFKTRIQKFLQDYCEESGTDYDSFKIKDAYGLEHPAKSIWMITTESAVKWKKFVDLLSKDNDPTEAYHYWCDRVKADGDVWGIVKTDHPSKLLDGTVQQMSYQMVNTLPCTKDDIHKICLPSIRYVEKLKADNEELVKFLRSNATAVNHYNMLADLYEHNKDFANSQMWKNDKRYIIHSYVNKLRKGKITVNADNLTVCGNPYALLMYTVGEDWETDPTLNKEDGAIQVYTTRFDDGEYLCGIRSPQNSSNNIGYFHNKHHPLMAKYFDFSGNIMAVNCIHTDIQSRMNGCDFDSDFSYTTNHPQVVEAAKRAYESYPTVVNAIPESGLVYNNTIDEYAKMDTAMQSAQKAIGGSSDSAQLSQSYMWSKIARGEYDDEYRQLYENTIILAVLAQVAIDSTKKVFAVDPNEDIKRIRTQECMKRKRDLPRFMMYAKDIPVTKNGRERPYSDVKKDRRRVQSRIDDSIICPMNWLQESLNQIGEGDKSKGIPTADYLVEENGRADGRKMGIVRKIVESYDRWTRLNIGSNEYIDENKWEVFLQKSEEVVEAIQKYNLSFPTVYRLVSASLGVTGRVRTDRRYNEASKYTRKMLNIMYLSNREKFLKCFKMQEKCVTSP